MNNFNELWSIYSIISKNRYFHNVSLYICRILALKVNIIPYIYTIKGKG